MRCLSPSPPQLNQFLSQQQVFISVLTLVVVILHVWCMHRHRGKSLHLLSVWVRQSEPSKHSCHILTGKPHASQTVISPTIRGLCCDEKSNSHQSVDFNNNNKKCNYLIFCHTSHTIYLFSSLCQQRCILM